MYFPLYLIQMITCPLCPATCFTTVANLLKHVRITHSDQENFCIQCNLQGCKRTFRKLKCFKNHIYTYHDIGALEESAEEESRLDPAIGSGVFYEDSSTGMFPSSENSSDSSDIPLLSETQLQRAAATWILKTRECHRIPLSVMDAVISDLQSLFQLALGEIRNRIELSLRDVAVPEQVVDHIRGELSEQSPYANVFQGLETQHQQLCYFRRNFKLVVRST